MSVADELEKLNELRQQGVLSFREFHALKNKLLSLVDDADSLKQLDEIKSPTDLPHSELDVVAVDLLDDGDETEKAPTSAAAVSKQDFDRSQAENDVPQIDIDVTGSSRFEKIDVPDDFSPKGFDADLDLNDAADLDLSSDVDLDLEIDNSSQLDKNELSDKVTQLDSQIDELKRQNAIASLERAWEREQKNYGTVDKYGQQRMPTKEGSIFGGVAVIVVGILFTVFSYGSSVFPLVGILVIVFGIGIGIYNYQRAEVYEQARRRYFRRRSKASRKP